MDTLPNRFAFMENGKQYEYGIRHCGCWYPLGNIAKHFEVFKNLQTSKDIESELKTIASKFPYMKCENSELEIQMDYIIHNGIPRCHTCSDMQNGVSLLLKWVAYDDCSYWEAVPDVATMQSIIHILDEWGASTMVHERYKQIFPYVNKGHFSFVENPSLKCFYVNKRWLSHWEMLNCARSKEGERCEKCYKVVPWKNSLNMDETLLCKCHMFYGDFLDRRITNPYFDDDNIGQREQDNDDALRRQD